MGTADESRRSFSVGAAMALVGLFATGFGLLAGGSAAFGAGSSGATCIAQSNGVTVHFTVAFYNKPPAARISGIVLEGFDSSCDSQPVTVTLKGNKDGDPSENDTDLKLLSVLEATTSPCSASPPQATIKGGSVHLIGCGGTTVPSSGAYASVHDVTWLRVEVNGQAVQAQPGPEVLGTEAFAPHAGNGAGTGHQPAVLGTEATAGSNTVSSILAATGGPSGILTLVGIVLLIFGLALVVSRLRRGGQEDGETPE